MEAAISASVATYGPCPKPSPPLMNSYFARGNKKLPAPPSPSPANESHLRVAATLDKGRHQHRPRASPGEAPSGIAEDSKFVPLNADDPVYGPPALLLVGFESNETAKIHQLLKDLDGEFLKVIHCTEDMISLTVWDAMHVQQQKLEASKKIESQPQICILSGLSGEEMMMFIDAFQETGLGQAVFAAMVPNSANKLLGEVVEEIMGDHEMLVTRKSL